MATPTKPAKPDDEEVQVQVRLDKPELDVLRRYANKISLTASKLVHIVAQGIIEKAVK